MTVNVDGRRDEKIRAMRNWDIDLHFPYFPGYSQFFEHFPDPLDGRLAVNAT